MRNESECCLKKEKMNERKESARYLSFEALVCFFCGFSRDASLDVWMKFRLSSDTQTSRCAFRPSAHRYNHHSERYNKSCMNTQINPEDLIYCTNIAISYKHMN